MAAPRRFEIDELTVRPGTYFNPQTEVLIVVDDSPDVDAEVFDEADAEGADWVLISEEAPVDEPRRDELIEAFQVRYHPAGTAVRDDEEVQDDLDEDEVELEPDPDPDD